MGTGRKATSKSMKNDLWLLWEWSLIIAVLLVPDSLSIASFIIHCHSYLSNVDCRPITSRKSTADETDFLQWGSWIYLGHCNLIHHRVLGEGAGADEMVDGLSSAGEPGGTILHAPPRCAQTGQYNTDTQGMRQEHNWGTHPLAV